MTNYLLIVTIVIFACVFLSRVSNRLGIPTLLFFILLGMVFGSDGILKIPFDNYAFAEQTCSIALIFIMFYGGFGTNWNQAKSVAVKSILLSTVGVVVTSGDSDESAIGAAAGELYKKTGNLVIVTHGSKGSYAFDGQTLHYAKPVPCEKVVDTIGAGDSHCGTCLAGLAAGKPVDEVLADANRIASLVVGSKGAALPEA